MKKLLAVVLLALCFMVLPVQNANAQIPIMEIIKQAITKVIVAVDLKIQRLQNKTIWLQNAQKVLENKMSELKLTEISDGKRMEIINEVDHNLDENLNDIREFNNQNKMMSLQRASEKGDIETVKKIYGL